MSVAAGSPAGGMGFGVPGQTEGLVEAASATVGGVAEDAPAAGVLAPEASTGADAEPKIADEMGLGDGRWVMNFIGTLITGAVTLFLLQHFNAPEWLYKVVKYGTIFSLGVSLILSIAEVVIWVKRGLKAQD